MMSDATKIRIDYYSRKTFRSLTVSSACEIISATTIKVTERDLYDIEIVH